MIDIVNFIGYEIGSRPKFDLKKPERQQAYLSGYYDPVYLSKFMKKFIEQVVLCPVCWLPETYLQIYGKKIVGVCQACGKNEELKIVNEKFTIYFTTSTTSTENYLSLTQ